MENIYSEESGSQASKVVKWEITPDTRLTTSSVWGIHCNILVTKGRASSIDKTRKK